MAERYAEMKDAVVATDFHLRRPSPQEMASAIDAAGAFENMRADDGTLVIQVGDADSVRIEPKIADQMIELLERVSTGGMVGFVPANSRVTTQQAADLLHVPHEDLIKLLEDGAILHLPPGYLCRVSLVDLMRYMEQRDANYPRAQGTGPSPAKNGTPLE